jgi:acetolactate synthase I/II/III large subunit
MTQQRTPDGAIEAHTTNAAHAAIEALARQGVTHVFGLAGTTTLHLLDALSQRSDIRYVSVRHEQVAGFMADGFARAGGELGVCMASRGPGAANLVIALHNAYAESVGVLAMIGQVDDEIVYRDAFEELDLVALFEPVTKWSLEVHAAARVPELVQRAAQIAMTGRRRPVMASIPLDVQLLELREPVYRPAVVVADPVAPAAEIERAAALLAGAERPVIVVGGGGARARDAVARLADRLQAPVAASWHRKAAFANGHPAFVGVLGFGSFDVTDRAVREADVVLSLGCRFSQFTSRRWTLLAPDAALVQVDIDAEELGRSYAPAVPLHGDAAATAEALAAALAEHEAPAGARARLDALRAEYERDARLPGVEQGAGVSSAAVVAALDAVRRRHDPTFVLDAPTFGIWMQRYLPIERAGSYFGNAGGAMGWGVPAAFGMQLAKPDERVICVSGDGSFWMVAQDLETAVRERIPVVTVVTNNFAYGNIRDRQRADHDGRHIGVRYGNPDFAAFARLLGAHGERVERGEELEPALERSLASGLPAVIDVVQDPDEGLPSGVRPPSVGAPAGW